MAIERRRFRGFIHPNDTFVNHVTLAIGTPNLDGQQQTLSIWTRAGFLLVDTEMEVGEDLVTFRNNVESGLRTYFSSLSLLGSDGFEFRLTHMETEMSEQPFDTHFSGLPEIALSLEQVFRHAGSNGAVRDALSDYLDGINRPIDTAFHCFRGLESLRQLFRGKDPKAQWPALHKALNTSKSYFDPLAAAGMSRRHAETVGLISDADPEVLRRLVTTAEQRRAFLTMLSVTLERTITWLERVPRRPLPKRTFPVLETPPSGELAPR